MKLHFQTILFSLFLVCSLSGKAETNQSSKFQNWQQIKQSKVIRALKLEWEQETALPRSGSTSLYHIELLNQFANNHDLTVRWIKVKNLNQMFEYIAEGKADVLPRHLTITSARAKKMNFTQLLLTDKELLVAKKGMLKPTSSSVIKVSVPKSSAYVETIKQHFPQWKTQTLTSTLSPDEIADKLANNEIDYTILDARSFNILSSYRNDIVKLIEMPVKRKLAWAVNKNNKILLNKLNEFIDGHHIKDTARTIRKMDLNKLKQEKLPLRIITRNSPETYFLWRGELMGFEYELMREFAKQHKVRLEVIVADSYQEMKQLLKQGKGDLIAAGLSRNTQRKSELRFSSRYNRVDELLIANKDSQPIKQLQDITGRTLTIRKSSAFWSTAQDLAKKYKAKLVAADENIPTELLIAQVADNKIDLTIADSNLVSIEKRFRNNIITPLILKESVPYAYAVRDKNSQLLNALNVFIKKEYRGTFYNVIKGKYFASQKRLTRYRKDRILADSKLSPYDEMVKGKASQFEFDWRLIVSQMFQESRFDPKARSAAGAQGLMQVLPRTAKELGYKDLNNPQQSIAAGVEYLNWTRARFSSDLPQQEKLYFALAAYNAGFGHVKDAQRLAKQMNLDPNKWFDNVEKAMLQLQKPEVYKKTRFGYCRGSEPVNYVREIQQRYLSYLDITQ